MIANRSFFSILTVVSLLSCATDSSNEKKRLNPLTKQKPQPQLPPDDFNLAASQTCGKKPAGPLPKDPTATVGIDLKEVEELLKNNELEGWVHGAAHHFGHYVFTYRGKSFFNHVELSMIPASANARQAFGNLKRHDKIRIGGQFARNRSPLKHMLIDELEVIEPYTDSRPGQYQYSVDLAKELEDATYIYGSVHTASPDGAIVVLEYKDAIVPLFVRREHRAQTKDLYRGDKIKVEVTTESMPHRPVHVSTRKGVEIAVKVIDHMVYCHDKPQTITGELILFPKSPQLSFPIFAIRNEDENGIVRNWTLVNFEDAAVFTAIREKLTKAWDEHRSTVKDNRNSLINSKIRITANGIMNVVSPNQANPQILLKTVDAFNFTFLD
jgi:hypothetical protein